MLLPQRIGHRRFHAYRAGSLSPRDPARGLIRRLRRWLRRQAGRPWADVLRELDGRLGRATEPLVARRSARLRLLSGLLPADGATGRVVWHVG